MLGIRLTDGEVEHEVSRIEEFIQRETHPSLTVVIGVSGGIDSDVTVRLCAQSLGRQRVRCFTILQEDMDKGHLLNARALCEELSIPLKEIALQVAPRQLLKAVSDGDSIFSLTSDGDVMRIKLSLRTVILSMYNEHGFVVAAPSNRTELETGLYMSFGDALGHIRPIVHLYKTQVRQIAKKVGTAANVVDQPPSSGLRKGADDLEDIAFWLQNGGPFVGNPKLDREFVDRARSIFAELTFEKLDSTLLGLNHQGMPHNQISAVAGLPVELVERVDALTRAAKVFKGRPLGASLL